MLQEPVDRLGKHFLSIEIPAVAQTNYECASRIERRSQDDVDFDISFRVQD